MERVLLAPFFIATTLSWHLQVLPPFTYSISIMTNYDSDLVNGERPQQPLFLPWIRHTLRAVSEHWLIRLLCLILLPVTILIYYPTTANDYDVWFHLAYGKHYVQNLTWYIDHSQFAWVDSASDWMYVTWLGSSLLYLAHLAAGYAGMYILQWLTFLAIFFVLYMFSRRTGFRLDLVNIMAILLMALSIKLSVIYIKPEMFSNLFFCLAVAIYFFSRISGRPFFYLYPLLFGVWINTHGAFVFGCVFLVIVILFESITLFFNKSDSLSKKQYYHLLVASLLSALFLLLNPYGLDYLTSLFKKIAFGESSQYFDRVLAYQSMWEHLDFTGGNISFTFVFAAWSLLLMFVFQVCCFLYIYFKNRSLNLTILAVNVCFFLVSMKVARASYFYPYVWFFSINYLMWKNDLAVERRKAAPLALAFFLFFSFISAKNILSNQAYRSWFGSGVEDYLPIKEVDFIMKNNLPGPIFNDYLIGGYMMWAMYPKYKVWIDPRYQPFLDTTMPDWMKLGTEKYPLNKKNLALFTEKYPFKVALVHFSSRSIIFWLIRSSDQWRLAYFDKTAAVLVHKSIIDDLSQETLATDLRTGRYHDLANPSILMSLFNFYINVGVVYGKEIRNIYNENVSLLYKAKQEHLDMMDELIKNKEREAQIASIQKQQQTLLQKVQLMSIDLEKLKQRVSTETEDVHSK